MTKAKPIFLLGAGASADAGIPLGKELTKSAVELLNEQVWASDQYQRAEAINFVVAKMVAHAAASGGRADEMPDIETVVSAIELLADRRSLEIAPFVQDWDPTIRALDSYSNWARGNNRWAKLIQDASKGGGFSDRNFDEAIREVIRDETLGDPNGSIYHRLRMSLMVILKKQLKVNDMRALDYLNPLIDLGGDSQVTVATLNYDLTIEIAAKRREIPLTRGIETWGEDWDLTWGDSGIKLIKLHGSIDWKPNPVRGSTSQGPGLRLGHQSLKVEDSETDSNDAPFIIYGRREKLRPEGPFLELRSEFASSLRRTSHLVVVGYSFSDDHVNEMIRKWLALDVTRRIFVIDKSYPIGWHQTWGEPYKFSFKNEMLSQLRRNEAEGTIRHMVESRIHVIGKSAKDALPEVCVESEQLDSLLESTLYSG